MELRKNTIRHFEVVFDKTMTLEQSAEMIVPDSYPDIAGIVDVSGLACLKEKAAHGDCLEVTGLVKAGILYRPEGGGALRKMDVNIPFVHTADMENPGLSACTARVIAAEARAVNPRKVQVGVSVCLEIKVFTAKVFEVGEEVTGECEVLRGTAGAYLLTGVTEKPVTVTEELEISASRPPAEDILKADVRFMSGEMKAIGSKAVFKGMAFVKLLYASGGEPYSVEQEFPFSQIIEMEGLEEGACLKAVMQLAGMDMDFLPGTESRKLGLTLYVDVTMMSWCEKKIETICDVYAVGAGLRPETETLSLTALGERITRRQTVREMLEVGEDVQNVIDASVWPASINSYDGKTGCDCAVKLVYKTESGDIRGLTRSIRVPAPAEAEGMMTAELAGEITATPVSGGLEVRFSMDFESVVTIDHRLVSVTGLISEDLPERDPNAPNVILRRSKAGETLWDIAKRYGSTRRELALCNKLENMDDAPVGKVLLIPRKR